MSMHNFKTDENQVTSTSNDPKIDTIEDDSENDDDGEDDDTDIEEVNSGSRSASSDEEKYGHRVLDDEARSTDEVDRAFNRKNGLTSKASQSNGSQSPKILETSSSKLIIYASSSSSKKQVIQSLSSIRPSSIQPASPIANSISANKSYQLASSSSSGSSSGINTRFICFAIILVVLGLGIRVLLNSDLNISAHSASSSSSDKQKELALRRQLATRLEAALDELKAKYNQSEMFWAHIESSFRHSVINKKDPSVVMFVSDPSTDQQAKKLIADIMDTLNRKVLQRNVS